jgi:hypothetical protein
MFLRGKFLRRRRIHLLGERRCDYNRGGVRLLSNQDGLTVLPVANG